MSQFLKVCGICALAAVALMVVGIGFVAQRGSALDGESRAYVEAAIPALATWDQTALLDRASPALKAAVTPAQLSNLYETCSRLGAIVSFEPPKGQSFVMYTTAASSETASYVTKAKFQNGDAVLKLALVKADGRWMINGFHVDPLTRLTANRA